MTKLVLSGGYLLVSKCISCAGHLNHLSSTSLLKLQLIPHILFFFPRKVTIFGANEANQCYI